MGEKTEYQLQQRRVQSKWKDGTDELPCGARRKGHWRQVSCDFLLPAQFADCNLWSPIRAEVLDSFRRLNIAFHDEKTTDYGVRSSVGPSPHLLDSQVCAINFWWPLQQAPEVLAAVLRRAIPGVARMVAPFAPDRLIEFEWMGLTNHLGERGFRRRGEFATSADALLAYEDPVGDRHGVLLESKYTEAYEPGAWRHRNPRGTDRVAIYRPAWELPDSPFAADTGVAHEDLFIEPFEQHLRQQLLGAAMARSGELGFKTVTCLHVAPNANAGFHQRLTSPKLAARAGRVGDAWKSLLCSPDAYATLSYEDAFDLSSPYSELASWSTYQHDRYRWAA